jgi:hypothetical protein
VAIFTHVTVGTNDLAKARSFYDSVLGALGYKRLNDLGDNGSIWGESAPENPRRSRMAVPSALSHRAGRRSRHSIRPLSQPVVRMKVRSGRAAGIPQPMPVMPAISTATRSRPTASSRNSPWVLQPARPLTGPADFKAREIR